MYLVQWFVLFSDVGFIHWNPLSSSLWSTSSYSVLSPDICNLCGLFNNGTQDYWLWPAYW